MIIIHFHNQKTDAAQDAADQSEHQQSRGQGEGARQEAPLSGSSEEQLLLASAQRPNLYGQVYER